MPKLIIISYLRDIAIAMSNTQTLFTPAEMSNEEKNQRLREKFQQQTLQEKLLDLFAEPKVEREESDEETKAFCDDVMEAMKSNPKIAPFFDPQSPQYNDEDLKRKLGDRLQTLAIKFIVDNHIEENGYKKWK